MTIINRIGVHLSHDSVLALDLDGQLQTIELERIFGKRHYDVRHESPDLTAIAALARTEHATFDEGLLVGDKDPFAMELFRLLGVTSIREVDHHAAHAAAAFYASPFDESVVVSYDGGGNDGTFRIFSATRDGGPKPINAGYRLNLGIPYRAIGHAIAELRKPDDGKERSNAGKLMGLAAYGEVRPEWIGPLEDYFHRCSGDTAVVPAAMYRWVVSQLAPLGARIGLDLSRNALSGRDAHDLARTTQHVFEELVLAVVLPIAAVHRKPICITGGCALNVIVNQRLADTIDHEIFVPPNPNDCGLALGAVLIHSRPRMPVNITYSGPAITDIDTLGPLAARYGAVEARPADIAQALAEGCAVAVMRGQSEHGPRALGNRSILCSPRVPGMKDRLNARIKFREGFRPYAPVVRREDIARYFENARHDLSYMSFNPTIRREWRPILTAATHVDGTARVQSVTREQNRWLYDVLTAFQRLSGFGVLVNTSFNSKGQPMVTRVADAVELFLSTDLDCLVIESCLFRKAVQSRSSASGSPHAPT